MRAASCAEGASLRRKTRSLGPLCSLLYFFVAALFLLTRGFCLVSFSLARIHLFPRIFIFFFFVTARTARKTDLITESSPPLFMRHCCVSAKLSCHLCNQLRAAKRDAKNGCDAARARAISFAFAFLFSCFSFSFFFF